LALGIKIKVKLWKLVINERKIHHEILECLSEILLVSGVESCALCIVLICDLIIDS